MNDEAYTQKEIGNAAEWADQRSTELLARSVARI